MSLLLMPKLATEKSRNKTGISRIFLRNMQRGERLTLAEAIKLLQAKW